MHSSHAYNLFQAPISFDPHKIGLGFTPEYCTALEKVYWKQITYNSPSYGADLLGSVFEKSDSGGAWNLSRLDNLLVNRVKGIPGVNK